MLSYSSPPVEPEIALLLGAGASVEAGCPTVEKLTETFEQSLIQQGGRTGLLTAYRWLVQRLREFAPVRDRDAKVDVELVLAALRELQSRQDSVLSAFVTRAGWRAEVRQYSSTFARLESELQGHIRRECEVARDRIDYLRPLRYLVPPNGSLAVFTLNYDCTVELLCQETGISYTDGFSTYWDPQQLADERFSVRLHKLHGSLLWYQTQRPPQRLVKIPISRAEDQPVRFFSDDDVSTSVIYPALTKEQHVEPYATLTTRLRDTLSRTSLLVVIGYSFRDAYLKDLILEKMNERPELHLLIIDPFPGTVLGASDQSLGGPWQFSAVQDRVLTMNTYTGIALADGFVARRIRDLFTALNEVEQVQELRLTAALTDRISAAGRAIEGMLRAGNVGGIISLMRNDEEGIWHAGASRLDPKGVFGFVANVLGGHNATPGYIDGLAARLTQLFNDLGSHAVFETNGKRDVLGYELGTTAISDPRFMSKWTENRAAKAREFADDLTKWKDQLRWHSPVSADVTAAFAADTAAIADYFDELGATWNPALAELASEVLRGSRMPLGPGTSMDQLGQHVILDRRPSSIRAVVGGSWST